MARRSAFEILDEIAGIPDKELRRTKLREACGASHPLTLLIQYTYHPDVVFDLPKGVEEFGRLKKSQHMDYGLTFTNIRKLKMFWTTSPLPRWKKIELFAGLMRDVVSEDVDLVVGVKDGVLPWKTLNKAFCYKALPELFPPQTETSKEAEPESD